METINWQTWSAYGCLVTVQSLVAAGLACDWTRTAGSFMFFHVENHCDTQLWTRAAHLPQCL